jgi:hypothetical protein
MVYIHCSLCYNVSMNDKEKAIRKILYALRNPLVLMSIPDREEAIKLAEEHNVSAADLLNSLYKRNLNA